MSPSSPTTFSPAPLWRRLAAMLYDTLVLICIIFIAWQPTVLLPENMWPEWFDILLRRCYLALLIFGFFGWFWTHGGQTIGMRAWKIRLLDDASHPDNLTAIGWRQAFVRLLTATISLALFGLGFFWSLFDPEKRTWHDIASTSRLVKIQRGQR